MFSTPRIAKNYLIKSFVSSEQNCPLAIHFHNGASGLHGQSPA